MTYQALGDFIHSRLASWAAVPALETAWVYLLDLTHPGKGDFFCASATPSPTALQHHLSMLTSQASPPFFLEVDGRPYQVYHLQALDETLGFWAVPNQDSNFDPMGWIPEAHTLAQEIWNHWHDTVEALPTFHQLVQHIPNQLHPTSSAHEVSPLHWEQSHTRIEHATDYDLTSHLITDSLPIF